ncbi:sortase [Dehalococcoidia bacterium]|nr:sortase [Dehalococcoidia bacterium]
MAGVLWRIIGTDNSASLSGYSLDQRIHNLPNHLPLSARKRIPARLPGLAAILLGTILIMFGTAYYIYDSLATQKLDSLKYIPNANTIKPLTVSLMTLEGLRVKSSSILPADNSSVALSSASGPTKQRLYPGEWLTFDTWAMPWSAMLPPTSNEAIINGFHSIRQFALGGVGKLPAATHISIPAIELEADLQELRVLDMGDYRQYETPKNVVGHIPESANAGEEGNIWLFGHLQSPVMGEGAIFRDLPQIPKLLRAGQQVYVVLESPLGQYLYEIYGSDVIHKDSLQLKDKDGPFLTLVTCVPPLVYSHRLLIMGKLLGFKPIT